MWLLIAKGADRKIKNARGYTPLDGAVLFDDPEIIKLLKMP
jgi:ankyrin repeat protein